MKRIAIALTASLAFALAGCGEGIASSDGPAPTATKSGESKGSIRVFNVDVNGKSVTCIESYSWVNNGAGVGLSCDFGATP